MSSMYGYDAKSTDDPCILAADKTFTLGMELLSPGGSLINLIPLLRFVPPWFPGAISQQKAQEARMLTKKVVSIPLEFTKAQVAEGNARPSVVGDFLKKKNTVGASKEEEEATLIVASTAYAAASDTTQSATGTFIYLMVCNPDIQRKAQAEIDSVLGGKRLPTYEDRPCMPYNEAIYREVLRWRPPGSVGVPHCSIEDDFYDGYFIPKGSTLLGNIWAMTHDETRYENPMSFNPERFFNPDGTLNDDDRIMAFGFGRRVCIGKHVASATVIPAVFNLEKARDKSGNTIEVNDEYCEFGLISRKKPFVCSIVPRSDISRELVEKLDT
ncbi:Cytochrome P450 monooxygenase 208 [Psilocybe cubensis]|uniref:Cytochrome P450 monooxygenase 208 n=2 Tax=Psilocybe cubensis TaxID=181762 RepID=A0ACB8GST0_PSICU|nr:Cytochrome P450 monooxygenase 208 [Psilocybe cubensis]KAH9478084.1 Cytochrome P450 monooxygenase 208 [Psilocybe cubensis]